MKNNTFKIIVISAIIVVVLIFMYFVFSNSLDKNENYDHLKNYKSNEYIPTYVSSSDMAKIYLNDYLYYARYNPQKAYDLLDTEYKKVKFSNLGEFQKYISKFSNKNIKALKYSKKSEGEYILYYVYDDNNNVFIFKTNGVMQYSVYLDSDTVEIG